MRRAVDRRKRALCTGSGARSGIQINAKGKDNNMSKSNKHEAKTPSVVIDWQPDGFHAVYADPNVKVYARCSYIPDDLHYRYFPISIPAGWLDVLAGYDGDGSISDLRARAMGDHFIRFVVTDNDLKPGDDVARPRRSNSGKKLGDARKIKTTRH